MTSTDGARSALQWREYLADYSADVLRVRDDDELTDVSDAQRSAGWLGFDGADDQQIAALEERLGSRLPPSFRSFLAVSNGWFKISYFMYTMRTTSNIDWLRNAEPELVEIIKECDFPEESALVDRALLISDYGDCQYWLLDPGDMSANGEWAAYTWTSWRAGFSDRHDSFAALVDDERKSFARLNSQNGRPIDPVRAQALVAEGRDYALKGDVASAADAFEKADMRGSGAGLYLHVILDAFLKPDTLHERIYSEVASNQYVINEIGLEHIRAEAVPLFLQRNTTPSYLKYFEKILTTKEIEQIDTFIPPMLPEPPQFQAALDHAEQLVLSGSPDEAWTVVEAALPYWHSDSPHRFAPVVLLTDPILRHLITAERALTIVTTPRDL